MPFYYSSLRFAARLADEYILIVPFAYHLLFRLTDLGIPAQQQAGSVACHIRRLYDSNNL
jgi:hypothetical protein